MCARTFNVFLNIYLHIFITIIVSATAVFLLSLIIHLNKLIQDALLSCSVVTVWSPIICMVRNQLHLRSTFNSRRIYISSLQFLKNCPTCVCLIFISASFISCFSLLSQKLYLCSCLYTRLIIKTILHKFRVPVTGELALYQFNTSLKYQRSVVS